MDEIKRFTKVVVLGAAGKMGSGILLLTAMEMAEMKLKDPSLKMDLCAIDLSAEGLKGLQQYLQAQVLRAAEKKTVMLRKLYEQREDLVENGEIIEQYVNDVAAQVRTSTHLGDAYGSNLVFEAIKEDPVLKVKVLSEIDAHSEDCWFFTNTSSIPISKLNLEAKLKGRILGFHFYNPPAVQKLVELIASNETKKELVDFGYGFAKNLRKTVVPSNDFAGFIGNGHFMRDALYGINESLRLSKEMSLPEAMYAINQVSQTFMLRPMGIFQLIDYVGVDVVKYIMSVMNPYLKDEDLHSPFLDQMMDQGILGGQYSDGSQKDGCLQYQKGRPTAVYDLKQKKYVELAPIAEQIDKWLGELPLKENWKSVNFNPAKSNLLSEFFAKLNGMKTVGAELAIAYGKNSKLIGQKLVDSGVANSAEDLNKALETGFYHAYGPINEYFK